jgi:hypothetical protein
LDTFLRRFCRAENRSVAERYRRKTERQPEKMHGVLFLARAASAFMAEFADGI